MPVVENYKIWHKAVAISGKLITFTVRDDFVSRNFGLRDQLQRSAFSIASNIAEGIDRKTDKEFARFLIIARGSLTEARTQLIVLANEGHIDKKVDDDFQTDLIELHKMINALLKKLKFK